MNDTARTILVVFFVLMILAIISVAIPQGSEIAADFGDHIMGLLRRARIFPPNKEFIQIFLIAGFSGWAINRFRRMK